MSAGLLQRGQETWVEQGCPDDYYSEDYSLGWSQDVRSTITAKTGKLGGSEDHCHGWSHIVSRANTVRTGALGGTRIPTGHCGKDWSPGWN
jgi:hypothetical protein